jgi:hypothetical protein
MRTYQCSKAHMLIIQTFVVLAGFIRFMLERLWINTFQHVIITAKCVTYSVPYSVREKKRTANHAMIIIGSQLPCCQLYRCFFFHMPHCPRAQAPDTIRTSKAYYLKVTFRQLIKGTNGQKRCHMLVWWGNLYVIRFVRFWSGAAEKSGLLRCDALFWVSSFWHF